MSASIISDIETTINVKYSQVKITHTKSLGLARRNIIYVAHSNWVSIAQFSVSDSTDIPFLIIFPTLFKD